MHSVLVRFGFLLENIKENYSNLKTKSFWSSWYSCIDALCHFKLSVFRNGFKVVCLFFCLITGACSSTAVEILLVVFETVWLGSREKCPLPVCVCCHQALTSLSLSLLLVLCFRGGGWQGFAALPQPALLQGLSGPRPPANHQRQPLPPHCSLWVHITLYRSPLPPSGLHHCCTPLLFLFLLFFDLILSAASLYVCNCLFHSLAPFLGYNCQPSSTS